MDQKFYITLPSNVSSPDHHNNSPSHFFTYLASPLHLPSHQWEVSLCEISFPHVWDNIFYPMNVLRFVVYDPKSNQTANVIKRIPIKHYENLDELVAEINEACPEKFHGRMGFEKMGRQRVKMVLHEHEGLKIDSTLAKILGFGTTFMQYSTETAEMKNGSYRCVVKADRIGDIKAVLFNIFVYTNIIKDQIVGNQLVPLLRTVSIEGEDGDYIHKVYDAPHYLPLASDFIQHIEIKLADDLGRLIQFQTGKVVVKLHFRKKHFWL
jgi:hypothetical protein